MSANTIAQPIDKKYQSQKKTSGMISMMSG